MVGQLELGVVMNRRDLLKWMLASPLAATVDVERLLWVPKPIVVVPTMPTLPPVHTIFMYGSSAFTYSEGMSHWVHLTSPNDTFQL